MITAIGCLVLLMIVQILVADVAGIRAKHIPGSAVPVDHDSFLFRATRTVANTNESIAVFVLGMVYCVLSESSPVYVGYATWGFVISRTVYAACYYANFKIARSVSFAFSLAFIVALLSIGTFY